MTTLYFVRHAQSDHHWEEDRTRPLTPQGLEDTQQVLAFFRDKQVDGFYSSPYVRSRDTIASTASFFGQEILFDERFRERQSGKGKNTPEMMERRWENRDFHEESGESIHMVQKRNLEAMGDVLRRHPGQTIVIGTHGTALSSILSAFDPQFNVTSFFRIWNWMPYVVRLDFQGESLVEKTECLHVEKEFIP